VNVHFENDPRHRKIREMVSQVFSIEITDKTVSKENVINLWSRWFYNELKPLEEIDIKDKIIGESVRKIIEVIK